MIALAGVGGIIHIGSQSKFIPYVIEVDTLGQALAAGPVSAATKTNPRVIHASVAEFITDARLVTPDVALQRQAVFRIYAKLATTNPATAKMNEWLNGTPESSPFKRAAKHMVSIDIQSVLPHPGHLAGRLGGDHPRPPGSDKGAGDDARAHHRVHRRADGADHGATDSTESPRHLRARFRLVAPALITRSSSMKTSLSALWLGALMALASVGLAGRGPGRAVFCKPKPSTHRPGKGGDCARQALGRE